MKTADRLLRRLFSWCWDFRSDEQRDQDGDGYQTLADIQDQEEPVSPREITDILRRVELELAKDPVVISADLVIELLDEYKKATLKETHIQ